MSKERSSTTSYVVFAATVITFILFALTVFSVVMPNRVTWMMDLPQASSYAYHIDGLFGLITYLVGFWFILSEIVLFYFIFRYRRKTPDQKAEYVSGEEPHEKQWISLPHILVIVCDIVLVVATIFVWYKVKQTLPPTKPENVIKVMSQGEGASNFAVIKRISEHLEKRIIQFSVTKSIRTFIWKRDLVKLI
mgnify:CR=1 FL=1